MNNVYSLIILLFNDLHHYSLFTILSFSNFSNQQLCTNLHTSSPTKAKPPGTHARNVVKKTALPYTSMVTHINPSTRKLASAIVLLNVVITIHQNNTFLITPPPLVETLFIASQTTSHIASQTTSLIASQTPSPLHMERGRG